MKRKITVIPGDGIGPEVTAEAVGALQAVAEKYDHEFSFVYALMGAIAIDQTGDPLPQTSVDLCRQSDAVLLGAIGDPKYDKDPTAKVRPEQGLLRIRKELNLFANIRPVIPYRSLQHLSPLKGSHLDRVDFVIYRELTGGIYFGEKKLNEEGTEASDICKYSVEEISRVAKLAFEAAGRRRNKLTLVDKANVLETSRLWRKVVQEMSEEYPEVSVDYMYVDNAAMQLMLNPQQFDVILTENMFGDILSDEASVLSGSLGLLPSSSVGDKIALFEPIHGSYPQAAGKDIANPTGAILSAAMMLDYFGMHKEAEAVRNAVEWALSNGFVTQDLNDSNPYSTSTLGEIICDVIRSEYPHNFNLKNVRLGKTTII